MRPFASNGVWVAAMLVAFVLIVLGGIATEYVTAFGSRRRVCAGDVWLRSDVRNVRLQSWISAAVMATAASLHTWVWL